MDNFIAKYYFALFYFFQSVSTADPDHFGAEDPRTGYAPPLTGWATFSGSPGYYWPSRFPAHAVPLPREGLGVCSAFLMSLETSFKPGQQM